MKKLFLISGMALGFLLFLVSCSSSGVNHTMEDNLSMSGATHEEALKNGTGDTDKKVQKEEEIKVSVPVDEESIVWDGKTETMHPMDNGSDMSWTEEEMNANE